MNNTYEVIKRMLQNKKEELDRKQDYFKVMCDREMHTSNFERNAINDLMVMMTLKTEIQELETILGHLEIERNCNQQND